MTNPEYRERVGDAIRDSVEETGVDGLAVDLAVRTPELVPLPLARLCAQESGFCGKYAEGMDATFAQLREALGKRAILFNGLWRFGPDMVNDQAKLLRNADAAIVEYFGVNPRKSSHSFRNDIRPYIRFMERLPDEKRLFVYGRAPWKYLGHQEDYRWQRYLYASYLLASDGNTHFKHHATFQVPRECLIKVG